MPGSSSADKTDTRPNGLHPVYTVSNIKNHVRVLDGVKVTYPSWVRLFKLHATGYDVIHHLDANSTPPRSTDTEYNTWKKIDAVILQWIYGTLSDDLLPRVLADESTALEAWERVKNLFLNNKGSRAAALQHELTNLTLSAMPSLEDYCHRIRDLSDQLTALECPINDMQQVLYLVRGLPRDYDGVSALLNQTLPSWKNACNQLQSEARRLTAREDSSSPIIAATFAP